MWRGSPVVNQVDFERAIEGHGDASIILNPFKGKIDIEVRIPRYTSNHRAKEHNSTEARIDLAKPRNQSLYLGKCRLISLF